MSICASLNVRKRSQIGILQNIIEQPCCDLLSTPLRLPMIIHQIHSHVCVLLSFAGSRRLVSSVVIDCAKRVFLSDFFAHYLEWDQQLHRTRVLVPMRVVPLNQQQFTCLSECQLRVLLLYFEDLHLELAAHSVEHAQETLKAVVHP